MINPVLEKNMLERIQPQGHEEVLASHEPSKNHEVLIVGGDDYRVNKAFDLEIETMSELGDPPEEVYQEFVDLNADSTFLLLFNKKNDKTPENIEGVMRLIPYIEGFGNKTLNDLSEIQDLNVGFTQEMYKKQTGCKDVEKVLDIGTLAFPTRLSQIKKAKIGADLMSTATKYLIDEYKNDRVTHLTVFNQYQFHEFLTGIGYPFKIMQDPNGEEYKPMVYSTFSGIGMTALPAWVSMSTIYHLIEKNKTESTNRSIASVAMSDNIEYIS